MFLSFGAKNELLEMIIHEVPYNRPEWELGEQF